MRFSVIVPVYMQEAYIADCVHSILAQGIADIEVLLIDDGSTDSSPRVCDELAALDSRVRVIHKCNEGPSVARNMGTALAEGDYLLFVDGDDLLAEGALKAVDEAARLNGEPDLIVCCIDRFVGDASNCRASDGVDWLPDSGTGDELALCAARKENSFSVSPCRYAIKRSWYASSGVSFKNGLLHEDELFSPLLICSAQTFAVCRSKYYLYRNHEGSRNTDNKLSNKLDFLYSAKELLNCRSRFNDSKAKLVLLETRARWLFVRSLLESTALKGNTARSVAKAAAPVCAAEPSIVDTLPKLSKLVKLLGVKPGIAAFLRLVKVKRGIKKLLGK